MPRRPDHQWTPEEDALLGTMPDAALAACLDLCTSSVVNRRIKLGIDSFRALRAASGYVRPAKPRTVKTSGKGIERLFTAQEDALMGTMSDFRLAQRLGCCKHTVRKRRVALGIPAKGRDWPPGADALLGTLEDKEVAAQLGITIGRVSYRRKILGIPAFQKTPQRKARTTTCSTKPKESFKKLSVKLKAPARKFFSPRKW